MLTVETGKLVVVRMPLRSPEQVVKAGKLEKTADEV